jgi:hypothetical protein
MLSPLFSSFQENTKCESGFFAEHVRVAYLFFFLHKTAKIVERLVLLTIQQ